MSIPVVKMEDVAECLNVCRSTFQCFSLVSRPNGLPFERIKGPKGRAIRHYHVRPVIEWLRQSAPEKCTADFEERLYDAARKNQAEAAA